MIVYRTGRAWHSPSLWSDVWNDEWGPDDLSDALGILKVDQIAAGIRWHYENGYNRLADYTALERRTTAQPERSSLPS